MSINVVIKIDHQEGTLSLTHEKMNTKAMEFYSENLFTYCYQVQQVSDVQWKGFYYNEDAIIRVCQRLKEKVEENWSSRTVEIREVS